MHTFVAIITKEKPTTSIIRKYMAPYKFGTRVERYISQTKEQVLEVQRYLNANQRAIEYEKYLKHPFIFRLKNSKIHTDIVKNEYPALFKMNDEELYAYAIKKRGLKKLSSYGNRKIYCEALDENGNITSTDNPNGFWDFYTTESIREYPLKDKISANMMAKIKDIATKDEICTCKIFSLPDIQKSYAESTQNGVYSLYSPEEFKKIYPTFADFAYSCCVSTPFVIDHDGNLYCMPKSASVEEAIEWERNYYDRFLKNNGDYYIIQLCCDC